VAVALSLAGCASTVPLREPPPAPVPVARFLLDVEGLEAQFPGEAGGLVPTAVRVAQTAADVAEAAATVIHPEGSAVKAATDSVYTAFAEGLGRGLGVRLLPLDALKGEVPYLVGAPMGRADRVATSGRYGGALEVDVSVEVPDAGQSHWSVLGTGQAWVSGHPEMTVAVQMVGAGGAVVWRDRVRVRSAERVTLDERWVLGVRTDRSRPDGSTLPALMREAVSKMVRRNAEG
jgi:hypothetical protein